MKQGIDGLLEDKTRPSAHPSARSGGGPCALVALTLADPPVETTHPSADLTGTGEPHQCASAVRRIWKAVRLQPHRYRQFKLSNLSELRRQAARSGRL